jgi:hypothetical protein
MSNSTGRDGSRRAVHRLVTILRREAAAGYPQHYCTLRIPVARPAVVSSAGEEYRLQRTGTYRQAQTACRRLKADWQRMGDAVFCRQHGLPGRFAD